MFLIVFLLVIIVQITCKIKKNWENVDMSNDLHIRDVLDDIKLKNQQIFGDLIGGSRRQIPYRDNTELLRLLKEGLSIPTTVQYLGKTRLFKNPSFYKWYKFLDNEFPILKTYRVMDYSLWPKGNNAALIHIPGVNPALDGKGIYYGLHVDEERGGPGSHEEDAGDWPYGMTDPFDAVEVVCANPLVPPPYLGSRYLGVRGETRIELLLLMAALEDLLSVGWLPQRDYFVGSSHTHHIYDVDLPEDDHKQWNIETCKDGDVQITNYFVENDITVETCVDEQTFTLPNYLIGGALPTGPVEMFGTSFGQAVYFEIKNVVGLVNRFQLDSATQIEIDVLNRLSQQLVIEREDYVLAEQLITEAYGSYDPGVHIPIIRNDPIFDMAAGVVKVDFDRSYDKSFQSYAHKDMIRTGYDGGNQWIRQVGFYASNEFTVEEIEDLVYSTLQDLIADGKISVTKWYVRNNVQTTPKGIPFIQTMSALASGFWVPVYGPSFKNIGVISIGAYDMWKQVQAGVCTYPVSHQWMPAEPTCPEFKLIPGCIPQDPMNPVECIDPSSIPDYNLNLHGHGIGQMISELLLEYGYGMHIQSAQYF